MVLVPYDGFEAAPLLLRYGQRSKDLPDLIDA